MDLSFFIARRYLFAKKSHNVINLIAYISLVGVLLGSAALVIVMSVFNGFEDLTESLYNTFDPELKISAVEGKTFMPDSTVVQQIAALPGVGAVAVSLEENVLIRYEGQQAIAIMKGIDHTYEQISPVQDAVYDGSFSLHHGEVPTAVLGQGIAARLGLSSLRFLEALYLYVPKRGEVSISNPAEALSTLPVYPAGIFMVEHGFDEKYIFVSIDFARQLLNYTDEVSALEITLAPNADLAVVQQEVAQLIGSELVVKNRYEQNVSLYKMFRSEKLVTYFILLFIIIILSFNISGSLFMLIIEKREDISTFQSMGASDRLIRRVFLYEGWLISLLGMLVGVLLGIILCVLQQKFAFIRVPGQNLIVDGYPVLLRFVDILIIMLSVSVVGYLASWLSVSYLKTILKKNH